MGIIDGLKRMIFGATAEPAKQSALPRVGKTVGELQSEPMSAWGDDDIIVGLRFSATMQLRTPLRVLLRHGEIHADRNTAPPQIVLEGWEGIWVAKTNISDKLPPYWIASEIGPIFPNEYLPFLVAVRKIVETHEPIERRNERLREMLTACEWQGFIDKHGGVHRVIRNFFPRFVDAIPKITAATIDELSRLGLDTPNRIAATSDETLLGIKGIGAAKLAAIRDYCAGITDNRDANMLENVTR